jgi:hypothetical protein
MSLDSSAQGLVIGGLVLLGIFVVLFVVWRRLRRGGPSAASLLGATYEFYNADQRAAVEAIVDQAAGKQEVKQASGDPPRKGLR